MESEHHGLAGHRGTRFLAVGQLQSPEQPLSDLAAQLVDKISTAGQPDRTEELRKLYSTIDEVRHRPQLLNTEDKRVNHNHLLIYFYTLITLDGPRWDDLFGDPTQLRIDALNAVGFLHKAISDTPGALHLTADGRSFLSRGREPLWRWLLPRLIHKLGLPSCLDINPSIIALCLEIIRYVHDDPSSSVGQRLQLIRYFQGSINGLYFCAGTRLHQIC
jgi:serine/threonine-protein kinase ATR